ncbi:MAG: hypothetical protein FJ243_00360 [Nitrospira sp.]|nr:hypothetical protein [Nitrospira sp.]
MVELGKIEKPTAEHYKGKRKLYCVSNIYPLENAPDEYKVLFAKYWDEVAQHIERLEPIGKVKKIFYEMIFLEGEEGLTTLSKMNERASQIIKKKVEEGGTFHPLEKREIFAPFLDWSNCLRVVSSEEVIRKVFEFYTECLNKRLEYILSVIESNLRAEEAALLIMRDEDRAKLQFPADIEVFLVTPPSYDDILKWMRKQWE